MSFNIVTVVWGRMIDWYLDWQMPSLLQPGNLPSLKNATYSLYTDEPDRFGPVLGQKLGKIKFEVLPLVSGRGNVNACVKHAAARLPGHLAVMPPEFIFGDSTLRNLEACCEKDDLVLYAFPRCRLEAVDEIILALKEKGRVSNAELVSLAMKYLHRETAPPMVYFQRLPGYAWKVRHLTPNLVIKISEKSLEYINSIPANNGLLDHCIPFLCVENGMSYHYVQSSDEVFLIEPTKRSLAFCPTLPIDQAERWEMLEKKNQDFWRTFTLDWKGEPNAVGNELSTFRYRVRWIFQQRLWPLIRRFFPRWLPHLGMRVFHTSKQIFTQRQRS